MGRHVGSPRLAWAVRGHSLPAGHPVPSITALAKDVVAVAWPFEKARTAEYVNRAEVTLDEAVAMAGRLFGRSVVFDAILACDTELLVHVGMLRRLREYIAALNEDDYQQALGAERVHRAGDA